MCFESTGKISVETMIVELLHDYGVGHLFVSPGSRNATILEAAAACKYFDMHFAVDERSSAFSALGYSLVSEKPVALICTSGTALLNYGPAVAEAYYRGLPLIVVSADRPQEWIGQDDSQTMAQTGVYSGFIRSAVNIPVLTDESSVWHANRLICESLMAMRAAHGPVHINVQIAQPSPSVECRSFDGSRPISVESPRRDMTVPEIRALAAEIASPRKVMIVAGFMQPSSKLNRALAKLSLRPNVVVVTETISNLHSSTFVGSADMLLMSMKEKEIEDFRPDVVISCGGALVSRRLKAFLRSTPRLQHWYVGRGNDVVDCFKKLTRIVRVDSDIFFEQLASAMMPYDLPCTWSSDWSVIYDRSRSIMQSYSAKAPWSDLKALALLIPKIPKRWNVHFSNGTPIRYAQLFNRNYHRCDCNRGVSGIDGSTSTAVGASLAYNDVTLLISGDTSACYDIGAFGLEFVSPRFKMIVMRNGGGGIFRFIGATRNMAIRERYLCGDIKLPLQQLCDGYGMRYFCAHDADGLIQQFDRFVAEINSACVLEIFTPAEESAEVLDKLLNGKCR